MKYQDCIEFDALYDSYKKCRKGVIWKTSVAHFALNDFEEILRLSNELKSGSYKERPMSYFRISHPKPREIASSCFRDTVYHRSLNDNILYPAMAKSLIYDNCACQKGKGTDFARRRMKCHMQRHFRKFGLGGWILQCDVRGYYPNMRHDAVKEMFRRKLDDDSYRATERILDCFEGDVGFNPGNPIVQTAGIAFLDSLDHKIKEKYRISGYIRYMDDFILLSGSKSELEVVLDAISEHLSGIGLELNRKKTRIFPFSEGVDFLGFRFGATDTGKIVQTIRSESVKNERRRLRKLSKLVKCGRMSREKCDSCYAAWKSHACKGDSYNLISRMDEFYNDLWR